jgi:RNA polymerase sigma-70 factor (ECF subfamily)
MIFHLSDASKSIVQQLIDRSDWDLLRRKLNEIGQNCKELLMFSADGYSDREIVELMTYKTADVVKTTRLRCLEKLRQLYKNNP